jgi:hypothetical protein
MRVLLAAVMALCALASSALAEIKIGSVLSITGPASFLGDPEKKTLEMYVQEINMTTAATPTRRAPSPRASSKKTRSMPCSAARSPAPAWP